MTGIEWTDKTWNPITGCSKISAGCANCYAASIAQRFWGDRKFGDTEFHENRLFHPVNWQKPRRVFVNSMSDLFHRDSREEWIDRILAIAAYAPQHTYRSYAGIPHPPCGGEDVKAVSLYWGQLIFTLKITRLIE